MKSIIGQGVLRQLNEYLERLKAENVYIITDDIVNRLYIDDLIEIIKNCNYHVYVIPNGEKSKSLDTVTSIYDHLIESNIDRNTLILSFGGGVVGDIAGFVAATYKRGLKYIQIPTTLLAQVDSSFGGKVGINYKNYKNIIGSFYLPEIIVVDIEFLKTLDKRQITCGLAEVLKYGLIYDYDFFKFVSCNINRIYSLDFEILLKIVKRAIEIKVKIVDKDLYDKGIRQILNFGHTIGHSIESYYDFSKYNHGESVILGMIYESFIAKELGLIDDIYFSQIYEILKSIVTPIKFNYDEIKKLHQIMKNDKKNINKKIGFILPVDRGKVSLFTDVDERIIFKSLKGEWI
jgi:3-dehydroquinate synthase